MYMLFVLENKKNAFTIHTFHVLESKKVGMNLPVLSSSNEHSKQYWRDLKIVSTSFKASNMWSKLHV